MIIATSIRWTDPPPPNDIDRVIVDPFIGIAAVVVMIAFLIILLRKGRNHAVHQRSV